MDSAVLGCWPLSRSIIELNGLNGVLELPPKDAKLLDCQQTARLMRPAASTAIKLLCPLSNKVFLKNTVKLFLLSSFRVPVSFQFAKINSRELR